MDGEPQHIPHVELYIVLVTWTSPNTWSDTTYDLHAATWLSSHNNWDKAAAYAWINHPGAGFPFPSLSSDLQVDVVPAGAMPHHLEINP